MSARWVICAVVVASISSSSSSPRGGAAGERTSSPEFVDVCLELLAPRVAGSPHVRNSSSEVVGLELLAPRDPVAGSLHTRTSSPEFVGGCLELLAPRDVAGSLHTRTSSVEFVDGCLEFLAPRCLVAGSLHTRTSSPEFIDGVPRDPRAPRPLAGSLPGELLPRNSSTPSSSILASPVSCSGDSCDDGGAGGSG